VVVAPNHYFTMPYKLHSTNHHSISLILLSYIILPLFNNFFIILVLSLF